MELPGTGSSAERLGYHSVMGYFEKNGAEKTVVPEMRGEGRVQELDGYGGRGGTI